MKGRRRAGRSGPLVYAAVTSPHPHLLATEAAEAPNYHEIKIIVENIELLGFLTTINLLMDVYADLCCSFGLPVWIASLLLVAKRLRSDCARRKKVYRLLHRKLVLHRVGVKEEDVCQPTYVYPVEVKMLLRSVFSKNICDYPDPCHDKVVYITVEDLHKVEIN